MDIREEIREQVIDEVAASSTDIVESTKAGHKFGVIEIVTGTILTVATAVTMAGVAYKNRKKIKKRNRNKQIAKWKKEGYVVCKQVQDEETGLINCVPITDEDFE